MVRNTTNEEIVAVHPIAHSRMMLEGISSAGYDAQKQILEIKFSADGQVWQFYDVPEYVWYEWRRVKEMQVYYHTKIFGKYRSKLVEVKKR
ncbi:MAG TPA: KTSC domain-containing protein [Lachnospiraceae bacterium]|nr:KTSC domain-containing protein [Lachnospiraceae bacterium]